MQLTPRKELGTTTHSTPLGGVSSLDEKEDLHRGRRRWKAGTSFVQTKKKKKKRCHAAKGLQVQDHEKSERESYKQLENFNGRFENHKRSDQDDRRFGQSPR